MASSTMGKVYYKYTLDKLLLNKDYTTPATMYFALFTKAPALDGTGGIEVLPNLGYVRIPYTTDGGWAGGTGNDMMYSNTSEVEFGKPTGDWGTVECVCLMDAPSGGNIVFKGFGDRQVINSVDRPPVIEIGNYRILMAVC